MLNSPKNDWQPEQEALTQDQRAAYDGMRERCPVAYSDFFNWSVFRHQDVMRTLLEDQVFSNRVSQYVSVPNGMDVPEHTPYRRLIEPYFSSAEVARFKVVCQETAAQLVNGLGNDVEVMSELAEPFAARIQCAFMGWSQELAPTLLDWLVRNNAAALTRDRTKLKAYAQEFNALIKRELDARRNAPKEQDVTTRLLHEQVNGRALNDDEIASILRNWTVGEVGTIANSIGIIIQFLATHSDVLAEVRAKPERLYYANNEILRLHNPLVDNRRITICPVTLSGRELPAGSRLTINWVSANRDPEVFPQADTFRWGRDEGKNLLYGAGVHICPGAEMAQMELVVIIRALLQATTNLMLNKDKTPVPARYPRSGYENLHVVLAK